MSEINKSLAFWRSFPIFEDLPRELIAEAAELAQFRRWRAGAVIFQRGDEGSYMILLTKGRIKVSLFTMQGKELSLRHFEPGSLIGEMSVLDGEPRSADAVSLVASEGYVLDKHEFRAFMARNPEAADAVVSFLCQRLRETNQQLETIALYNLDARVARFLLAALRQVHGDDLPEEARLELVLSQVEFGAILGASRPRINRAILELEEAGAIKRHGNIIDCRIPRLLKFAEPVD
jgi:CRP/FNR family transcriptional regulator, cyclic AMP receptor protein